MHASKALAQQAAGRQPVRLLPRLKGFLRLLQAHLEGADPGHQSSLVEGCRADSAFSNRQQPEPRCLERNRLLPRLKSLLRLLQAQLEGADPGHQSSLVEGCRADSAFSNRQQPEPRCLERNRLLPRLKSLLRLLQAQLEGADPGHQSSLVEGCRADSAFSNRQQPEPRCLERNRLLPRLKSLLRLLQAQLEGADPGHQSSLVEGCRAHSAFSNRQQPEPRCLERNRLLPRLKSLLRLLQAQLEGADPGHQSSLVEGCRAHSAFSNRQQPEPRCLERHRLLPRLKSLLRLLQAQLEGADPGHQSSLVEGCRAHSAFSNRQQPEPRCLERNRLLPRLKSLLRLLQAQLEGADPGHQSSLVEGCRAHSAFSNRQQPEPRCLERNWLLPRLKSLLRLLQAQLEGADPGHQSSLVEGCRAHSAFIIHQQPEPWCLERIGCCPASGTSCACCRLSWEGQTLGTRAPWWKAACQTSCA